MNVRGPAGPAVPRGELLAAREQCRGPGQGQHPVDLIGEGRWLGNADQVGGQPADRGQIGGHDGSASRQVLERLQGKAAAIEPAIQVGHQADIHHPEIVGQRLKGLEADPAHVGPAPQSLNRPG